VLFHCMLSYSQRPFAFKPAICCARCSTCSFQHSMGSLSLWIRVHTMEKRTHFVKQILLKTCSRNFPLLYSSWQLSRCVMFNLHWNRWSWLVSDASLVHVIYKRTEWVQTSSICYNRPLYAWNNLEVFLNYRIHVGTFFYW